MYLALKHFHITCVILSGTGFALRGWWSITGSPRLRARLTRILPHIVDSCLLASAIAGRWTTVGGNLDTIMAGLACGEPNRIAWDVLRETAEFAVSCPDYVSAKGMRILGNPIGQDRRVISGESGAVTLGLAASLMTREDLKDIRDRIGLNRDSKILCFSTEGDTDRKNYRRIVWDGLYPSL